MVPQEEFNQLIKAEALAEEAIEVRVVHCGVRGRTYHQSPGQHPRRHTPLLTACFPVAPPPPCQAAQEAGDFEEAELQEEALEELEEKVAEVAAAEESEAAHEQAAKAALEAGDMETVKREQALAAQAQAGAEMAEEDLADAVLAEQEIAEMSLRERMDPELMLEAVGAYAPKVFTGASAAVSVARSGVRTRLDTVLGDYPVAATLLEWLSLVLPVTILMSAFTVLRRDSAGKFSLRSEVLLFGHMYWAGYYALLAVATALVPAEPPLTAFARAQPEQYVSYQVFLMIAFLCYLALLLSHATLERTPLAALQFAGASVVYLHSYLTVFHRAIKAALPPAQGGAIWFALYAVVFTSMTFFIKRERKQRKD